MIRKLVTLLARGGTLIAPGAADALSARLIEAHGYECVYIGSYATAASRFAIPDTGLLTLDELAAQAKTIGGAVRIPVIADARQALASRELAKRHRAAGGIFRL
jgi:2-methylisocitrate lyase-like PEP mutase family enzyme